MKVYMHIVKVGCQEQNRRVQISVRLCNSKSEPSFFYSKQHGHLEFPNLYEYSICVLLINQKTYQK